MLNNSRPLDANKVKLLEQNFKEYIENDTFKFKIGNIKNHKNLNLVESNLEKICFAIGPGKSHIQNNNLIMEEYIKSELYSSKPIDFCYKVNYRDETRIMGFIENKILNSITLQSVSKKIIETTKQIYEHYLEPLKKDNKELYFSELTPKNFSISICLFKPDTYLSNPYFYYTYCNDRDSSPIERLEKYGFLMLTIFIHTDSIVSPEGLDTEFQKFLKQPSNLNGSLTIPEIKIFNGFIQKDVYNSIFNMSMTITLPQLNNIPYSNINPSSRIANTRNLSLGNSKPHLSLQKEIFFTLVSNYKKYESGKNTGYDLPEAYRSLGAKPREISFYTPQTIIHISDNVLEKNIKEDSNSLIEEKMNQQISFLTCNMSMIDGQHSSKSLQLIIEKLNSSTNLDVELQSIIDNVYGKHSTQFTLQKFKNFLTNHHINISFKGFSQEEFAQQAAINQNNIRKQTDIEKVINENREKILKIANSFNHRVNSKYKIDVNKGSWTSSNLEGKQIELVSIDNLVSVYGIWYQKKDFFSDFKNINRLLGKSNSPCNPITNSTLEKSIDWYIKMDTDMIELISKINKIIDQTYKIINFDNITDTEDSIDDLIQKNYKYISYLTEYLKKIHNKFTNNLDSVYKKLIRAIDEGNEDNWNALLDSLNKSNDMLSKHSDIWEERIDLAMLLYIKTLNFIKSSSVNFFTEKKTDTFYYVFNLINVFIRIKLLQSEPNNSNPIHLLNGKLIDSYLIELSKRLINAEHYVNQRPLKDFNYGGSKLMDSQLMTILFK